MFGRKYLIVAVAGWAFQLSALSRAEVVATQPTSSSRAEVAATQPMMIETLAKSAADGSKELHEAVAAIMQDMQALYSKPISDAALTVIKDKLHADIERLNKAEEAEAYAAMRLGYLRGTCDGMASMAKYSASHTTAGGTTHPPAN